MKWINASEGNPKKEGYYFTYRHHYKSYPQVTFWYADKGWSSATFEWLDEEESPVPDKVDAEIDVELVEEIYDAFANWYKDDGSYDTFLRSEAMKKINEFARQSTQQSDAVEDWKSDSFKFAVDILLRFKPFPKSITKAVEELNELSAKLLQFINKADGEVEKEDITEEIADVEMHLYLLKHYFPVTGEMRQEKITKFLTSKDYNSYLQKSQQ